MTYAETRDAETLRLLQKPMDEFIKNCHTRAAAGCACRTVFFFPAGMGSQLTRATTKFDNDNPDPPPFEYAPIWVNLETPFGGAADLAMHRDSDGTFRDTDDRIIVADAPLGLGFGERCTPHDGFIKWCEDNAINLFVFPWDWRRRLDETVTFFVTKFLPCFRSYVKSAGCPDPLERYAIVGHSFGGMIANLILRNPDVDQRELTHVITVATPFYGYAGQVHRWFEGDNYVNFFGKLEQRMMEMIATLPGLYTLHFLDGETYEANKKELHELPYPIPGYPSMDSEQKGQRADPYNPYRDGELVRYPRKTGFDLQELKYAKKQFQTLASPMEPERLQKFHNIRGVITDLQGIPTKSTVGSVTWDWIEPDYNADDCTPIHDDGFFHDGGRVPGDGTQPAWTTCLVTNAKERRITVTGITIEHAFMMNHSGVLKEIQGILFPDGGGVSPREMPDPKLASDDEMVRFLKWLSDHLPEIRDMERKDISQLKELEGNERHVVNLPSLAQRFISDVFKRPGPEDLRPTQSRKTPRKKHQ